MDIRKFVKASLLLVVFAFASVPQRVEGTQANLAAIKEGIEKNIAAIAGAGAGALVIAVVIGLLVKHYKRGLSEAEQFDLNKWESNFRPREKVFKQGKVSEIKEIIKNFERKPIKFLLEERLKALDDAPVFLKKLNIKFSNAEYTNQVNYTVESVLKLHIQDRPLDWAVMLIKTSQSGENYKREFLKKISDYRRKVNNSDISKYEKEAVLKNLNKIENVVNGGAENFAEAVQAMNAVNAGNVVVHFTDRIGLDFNSTIFKIIIKEGPSNTEDFNLSIVNAVSRRLGVMQAFSDMQTQIITNTKDNLQTRDLELANLTENFTRISPEARKSVVGKDNAEQMLSELNVKAAALPRADAVPVDRGSRVGGIETGGAHAGGFGSGPHDGPEFEQPQVADVPLFR